ncbi:MAG: NUDIX domain-containing protein [Bacteroidota bacterium]
MEEWVDLLDEQGNYTGRTALKSVAHANGLFHPTVHIWCYSSQGKVLLQQRGALKKSYPLKWDVSVAGHVAAGETLETGAIREVAEEIGVKIDVSQLQKIRVFKTEKKHDATFWDREFTHTYCCLLAEDTPLTKQDSEVEALQWITFEAFETKVKAGDPNFILEAQERHLRILKELRLKLQ